MQSQDSEVPPSSELVSGKYELQRLIGRGGMGSVWQARHTTLGTLVAIKFIDQQHTDNSDAKKRFYNEARAASTIQSKHAIQIFDHGETAEGKPYIVMELLDGESLEKRIEHAGAISLTETTRILQQVSRALARAHERGIVHRDLKPENIFLVKSPDEDDEIAKVLDFGIAKILPSPGEAGITSGTKTGAILGTPFYMSPEQARGLRDVDHRTDVWSLAAIAYKCVTGRMAFDGESVGDLLVKICTAPLPVPSTLRPDLPRAFDAWFARAMEREPSARYQSVQELCDALAVAAGVSTRIASHGTTSAVPRSGASDVPTASATTVSSNTGAPYTTGLGTVAGRSRFLLASVAALALGLGIVIATIAVVSLQRSKPARAEAAGLVERPESAVPSESSAPSATALAPATNAPGDGSVEAPTMSAQAASAATKPRPGGGKPAGPSAAPKPPTSASSAKKPPKPPSNDPGY